MQMQKNDETKRQAAVRNIENCASSAIKAQLCNEHFSRLNYSCQAPSISDYTLF